MRARRAVVVVVTVVALALTAPAMAEFAGPTESPEGSGESDLPSLDLLDIFDSSDETQETQANEGGEERIFGIPLPYWVLFGFVLVALVGVVLFYRYARGREADSTGEPASDTGRSVARSIEETEDGTFENTIYRAWYEMTAPLEVHSPETTSPAEFREAAIEQGFDSEDVETLTRLFRAVRYGDVTVTETREQEARELLGRFEDGGQT